MMKKSKSITISVVVGLAFMGSIASAAWATSVWNNPNSWIVDGRTISAQKLGENLEYLLSISGGRCTVYNTGATRYDVATAKIKYCTGGRWVSVPQ